MKGVLAQRCPADILSEVLRRQMSGILSLRRGTVNRQLFLDTGSTIRFAASTSPDESLVAWLLEKGGVTEAQIREATSRKESHELLGTVLVRLGHLDSATLVELTEGHVRRVLVGALRMSDGAWEFQQGALPFRDQLDAGVRTAEALLEWTRSLSDADWIRRRLGPIDARVHRDRRPPEGYQSIRLDPVEGFIMSRVDGAATIREIIMVSPTGEEKTLAALLGLSLSGILEPAPGNEPAFPPPAPGDRGVPAGPPVAPYSAAAPPVVTYMTGAPGAEGTAAAPAAASPAAASPAAAPGPVAATPAPSRAPAATISGAASPGAPRPAVSPEIPAPRSAPPAVQASPAATSLATAAAKPVATPAAATSSPAAGAA
ncbi:MAG TPA: DUF4388 domain-containing protein, partial [Candidatus Polarisedimenticolia bacterium]|nr:DUF4388 domain-containing protein [Candidatus Polarisedimenticolia bacterium]